MPGEWDPVAKESRRRFLARLGGLALGASGAGAMLDGCGSKAANLARSPSSPATDWRLLSSPGAVASSRWDPTLGRRVVQVTSGRAGEEARLGLERTSPVSLRNQMLALWLKVDADTAADVSYVVVKAGSGTVAFENVAYQEILNTGGAAPPAAMSYLLSVIKPGEWTRITLGPPSFVGRLDTNIDPVDFDDLRDFEIAVAAGPGTEARYSFGGMDVIAGDPRFPHGVLSLTFDDGLSGPYQFARPVLERYRAGATAFLIRDLIEPPRADGRYLSLTQLHELQARGWEIAAHANLIADHNAHLGFVGLPTSRVIRDVEDEVAWLRSSGFNGSADIALPQGWFDQRVQNVLVRYGRFQTVRTVDYRSVETLPVADPHRLRARLYNHTEAIGPPGLPGSIMWQIDQVARYGGWLILGFHNMVSRPNPTVPVINEGTAILATDFADIVAFASQRGVPMRTIRQVWDSHPGQAT
jgi:peptidoglycan/xylan/chitin deacetylase (PgdA/CDA1 family)